jgi:vancomycin resistance protein YoaR
MFRAVPSLLLIGLPVFFFLSGSVFAASSNLPSVTLSAGRFQEVLPPEVLHSWLHIKTKQVQNRHYQSEIETPFFCPTKKDFCDFATPFRSSGHTQIQLTRSINEDGIKKYLATVSEKINMPAEDAIFAGDKNNQVYVKAPEQLGQELATEKSLEAITKALKEESFSITVTLPITTSEPKIKASDKEKLGLKELIGEGHSNFAGSPKNRVYNIKRALEQFTGVVVLPGEEFSFVKYLGEVDGSTGYLPELVIRNNKTEPEFGGGICQVSSTVFRAAIYSGLKITERRNHSYAVQYYKPYGMDATIYVPRPDFKFLNNTGAAIVMQPEVSGSNLTFRFFGTRDGRVATVDGPHILEKNEDGSIKKTVFTQIVKDTSGQEMIKESFTSNYKSPKDFPHPEDDQTTLTEKPKNWSSKQWEEYKKTR